MLNCHAARHWQFKHMGTTLDLPDANNTTDAQINEISVRDQRVVITKDADFVNSFLVSARPYKLLLISTGNITNRALETYKCPNFPGSLRHLKIIVM